MHAIWDSDGCRLAGWRPAYGYKRLMSATSLEIPHRSFVLRLMAYIIFSYIRREIGMIKHGLSPLNIQPCFVKVLESKFVSRIMNLVLVLSEKKSLASRENNPSTISRVIRQF